MILAAKKVGPQIKGIDMLLGIIVAMFFCAALGLPIVPVLVVGGLSMAALSYCLTRDKQILHLLLALVIVAGSHFIIGGLLKDMPNAFYLPSWMLMLVQSDRLVGIIAVIVILGSAWLGIFGPMRNVPTDPDDLFRKIQDAEKQNRDSSN